MAERKINGNWNDARFNVICFMGNSLLSLEFFLTLRWPANGRNVWIPRVWNYSLALPRVFSFYLFLLPFFPSPAPSLRSATLSCPLELRASFQIMDPGFFAAMPCQPGQKGSHKSFSRIKNRDSKTAPRSNKRFNMTCCPLGYIATNLFSLLWSS